MEGRTKRSTGKRDRQSGRGLSIEFFRPRRIEPGDHRAALVVERELLAGDVPRFHAVDRRRAAQRTGAVAGAELGLRGRHRQLWPETEAFQTPATFAVVMSGAVAAGSGVIDGARRSTRRELPGSLPDRWRGCRARPEAATCSRSPNLPERPRAARPAYSSTRIACSSSPRQAPPSAKRPPDLFSKKPFQPPSGQRTSAVRSFPCHHQTGEGGQISAGYG